MGFIGGCYVIINGCLIQKGDLLPVGNAIIKGNTKDIYIGSFIMSDGTGYFIPTKDENLADARIKRPINKPSGEHLGWRVEWVGNMEKHSNKS